MDSCSISLKNKKSMLLVYGIISIICAALSIASLVLLIILSDTSKEILSFIFYSGSLSIFYIITSIYHFLPFGYKRKKVFFILSHAFFIMSIWGIYMPYTLIMLNGPLSWTMFGIITALAILGIVLRSILSYRWNGRSESIYYFVINWFWIISIINTLQGVQEKEIMFYIIASTVLNIAMIFYKLCMYRSYKRYTLFLPMFYFLLIVANSIYTLFMFRYVLI